MRIKDQKVLFACHTCDYWFYNEDSNNWCLQCTKQTDSYNNVLDRHREQCNKCEKIFEVKRKSPYENAHFLNCDNCMTVMKISYSDSILQKSISGIDLYDQDIGKSQINNYWDEIEVNLSKCLCGGEFKHLNSKKCPFCLEDIDSIGQEYLIVNNPADGVTIPVISKHIWKRSQEKLMQNLLDENSDDPFLKALGTYMKTLKYFQELYYEGKKAWAATLEDLKTYSKVKYMVHLYSFQENETLLKNNFKFAFEIFPDNYHLIAFPLNGEINQAYLLQGKTGEIEIHPAL